MNIHPHAHVWVSGALGKKRPLTFGRTALTAPHEHAAILKILERTGVVARAELRALSISSRPGAIDAPDSDAAFDAVLDGLLAIHHVEDVTELVARTPTGEQHVLITDAGRVWIKSYRKP